MKLLNVIVAGPDKAKKTALIKSVSDHVFSSPEQTAVSKKGEAYSVEFGRSQVNRDTYLYLAGLPVGRQFEFLWERLADNLLGFLIVFDTKSRDRQADVQEMIVRLKRLTDTPFVVLLDGITDKNDPRVADLKKELEIGRDERILCGDAADRETAKAALVQLLRLGAKIAKKVSA